MNAVPWNVVAEIGARSRSLGYLDLPVWPMNDPSPSDDVELLRRMVEGDTAALGAFYDLHAGTLFALACRMLSDTKEAEDLLQDVFMLLWEKAASFDPAQGRPLAWALTLTRNKAIDRLRASQRHRARFTNETDSATLEDPNTSTATAPDTVGLQEQGHLLRAALAELPRDQRQAIELAFFEGMSQTEIAAALNQPLGTIKARIRRGMLKLRSHLEKCL